MSMGGFPPGCTQRHVDEAAPPDDPKCEHGYTEAESCPLCDEPPLDAERGPREPEEGGDVVDV